jgi:uncharacterized membrane protein YobD (UPF0266 family)
MKKILKLSLLFAVAMTAMNTYAIEGDFLLNVKKGEGKEISFSLNNIKKINVAIYDQNNNLIFAENATGKSGIMKTYSLEEFPDGVYYLEVENSLKKVRHEIVIKKETTILSRKSISEVYKPSAMNKTEKLANVN